jgi:hypothetical protein
VTIHLVLQIWDLLLVYFIQMVWIDHLLFKYLVYPDGRVCISILHPPGEDPNQYESSSERWSPVQSVEKILLSVVSMLAEPNDESGANIDACVIFIMLIYFRKYGEMIENTLTRSLEIVWGNLWGSNLIFLKFVYYLLQGHLYNLMATAASVNEGRAELLNWANELLQLNINKIETFGTGAAHCQIFDSIFGTITILSSFYFIASHLFYLYR